MKFSLKIFLTTILIVCCTFSIGGTLLLSSWLQLSLDQEIRFAENQNMMLCRSLQTAGTLLPAQDHKDIRQVVENILSSVLPAHEQLPVRVSDKANRSVYQTTAFAGDVSVFEDVTEQEAGYIILNDSDVYTLHYLSHWQLGNDIYALETIHDISAVFAMRDQQYQTFSRLTLGLVFLIGILVFLLSKWLTKPICALSDAAKQMSGGNYGIRARIKQQDEIGDLAQEFNNMAEALERKIEELQDALRRQEEFSGSFAHEVKTPLTSIMGYADLLRSRELPQETRFLAANNIFQESKRLETLSFRLLDLMVLEKNVLHMETLCARTFLEDIARFSAPNLLEHGIELRMELEDAAIHIDVVLFRTLLLNLLANAQNAIDGDGIILLSGLLRDSKYQITVSDTGRGIPQEALPKVTEAFYRIDQARDRASGGAGLGLSLCKRIAEAHSGALEISSEQGHGTAVTVTIGGGSHEI